jgi:Putative peptidoglycan binding domain/N-acetylmuramoyl-L-alanine amidase
MWQYGKLFTNANDFIKYVKGNLRAKITEVHVHHTWKPSHKDFTGSNHRALQDGMKNYHTKSRGWQDIGQHATIFPDGSVMTGRNINVPPASAYGHNDGDNDGQHPFMFEMIGDFDKGKDKLQGPQLATAVAITRAFSDANVNKIKFHREMDPHKSCPGTGVDKSWFVGLVKGQVAKPSVPAYPGHLIRRGNRGNDVKLVQRRLGGLVVDGIFGPRTEAAVKRFQKVNKLAIDGIVGPRTWAKLFR